MTNAIEIQPAEAEQSLWQLVAECEGHPSPTHPNLLNKRNSLTEFLRELSGQRIQHILHEDTWGKAYSDELNALTLSDDAPCWIREIDWECDGDLWVFGRAVIPEATAQANESALMHVGKGSVGDTLFKDPSLERKPIEICQLPSNHPCYINACKQLDTKPATLWARRSVFIYHQHPLLISEVFMPAAFHAAEAKPEL